MTYDNKISQADELKQKISKHKPFDLHTLAQLKEYYRIDLIYSSNAIEGNSLTLTETKIVLEEGITIGGKPLKDHLEAIGHSDAYDFMYTLITKDNISLADLLKLHQLFYYRIDIANAGSYRKLPIIVTGSDFEFPAPTTLPELMNQFIAELPQITNKYHPIEAAAIAHNKFVTIHPFVDGNGRTGRLLMNSLLIHNGYVPVIIPPIIRRDYIAAVTASNHGNHTPFINFLSCMMYESLSDYQRMLRSLTTF